MAARRNRTRRSRALAEFLQTEAAGGAVLLVATAAALLWANSPWRESYSSFWHLTAGTSRVSALHHDLRHWVNDGLMAVFFFVVGLEIKREVTAGELRRARTAALPAVAAAGGMVAPALIFAAMNAGGPGADGWAIPMATDIAFAVGVLALLGSRVPSSAKLFLLTLAIVDDIGAIAVIAVFYSRGIEVGWLAAAAVLLGVFALAAAGPRWLGRAPLVVALASGVWVATVSSGVHATIAGVLLAVLVPAPSAERLEHVLHPWTSFLVVPVFALANAGVALSGAAVGGALGTRVGLGIIVGLVVGKPLGIVTASWVAVRLRVTELPPRTTWSQLAGVATLAGIGFTVSLFITELAFAGHRAGEAKLAVLVASVVASAAGAVLFLRPVSARSAAT